MLADCINDALIGENMFPDSLKFVNIAPVYKKKKKRKKKKKKMKQAIKKIIDQ